MNYEFSPIKSPSIWILGIIAVVAFLLTQSFCSGLTAAHAESGFAPDMTLKAKVIKNIDEVGK